MPVSSCSFLGNTSKRLCEYSITHNELHNRLLASINYIACFLYIHSNPLCKVVVPPPSHTHTHTQELLDDKSDWHHTLEKIKFIHKLSPDMPVPLEVFDSDVVLLKQGPLNQVLSSKKEVPRHCFLFNKFIAVAEKANDTQFRLLEVRYAGRLIHVYSKVCLV